MVKVSGSLVPPPVVTHVSLSESSGGRSPSNINNNIDKFRQNIGISLSTSETVLLSATGDVLVSRCRESSKAYRHRSNRHRNIWTDKPSQETDHLFDVYSWGVQCDNFSRQDCSQTLCPCNVYDETSGPLRGEVGHIQNSNSSFDARHERQGGLLGGAAPESTEDQSQSRTFESTRNINIAASDLRNKSILNHIDEGDPTNETTISDGYSNDYLEYDGDDDLKTALPIPSFDYSGIDMTESLAGPLVKGKRNPQVGIKMASGHINEEDQVFQPLIHGVPNFLRSLSQIRVTQVSAHPLGSHVLLISAQGLLFSYGLNDHGQLGIGKKSPSIGGNHNNFVTTPTIVTPVLENGGKAVTCAAGVNHSLVVIKTEGQRIGRLNTESCISPLSKDSNTSSDNHNSIKLSRLSSLDVEEKEEDLTTIQPTSDSSDSSLCHHQLYGFGSNRYRKLGLVSASVGEEDAVLPRRVALHCRLWPGAEENEEGIFAIAASFKHSAALVRRKTGAVEVYTWGKANAGALGLPDFTEKLSVRPKTSKTKMASRRQIVPKPTMVTSLSFTPSNPASTAKQENKVLKNPDEYPKQIALGPECTFVITSTGRCLSFGTSEDGLLGRGQNVCVSYEPTALSLKDSAEKRIEEEIAAISVGATHAVCITKDGTVYGWGSSSCGRLGFDETIQTSGSVENDINSSSVPDNIVWEPRRLKLPINRNISCSISECGKESAVRACLACAGYDSTVLVTDTGSVLTCGKQSGRLGLGEVASDVNNLQPMFGGLQLWRATTNLDRKHVENR